MLKIIKGILVIAILFVSLFISVIVAESSGGELENPLKDLTIKVSLETTHFTNQEETHETYLKIKLYQHPDEFDINYITCNFGGSYETYCGINQESCTLSGSEYTCKLTIPSINYTASPFYDSSKKQIILSPNTVIITFISGAFTRTLSSGFEDISIDVVPVCGKYGCESDLGENPDTCCIDCNCEGERFCYTGNKPEGECISLSQTNILTQFTPKTMTCTPFDYANQCGFTEKVDISQILNIGYKNYSLLEAGSKYEKRFYYLICQGQTKKSYLICPFMLPDLKGMSPVTRQIDFFHTITYMLENVLRTQNIEDAGSINIVPESQGVNTYAQQKAHLDSELQKLAKFIEVTQAKCDIFKSLRSGFESCCEHCIICCPCCPDPKCPCAGCCSCGCGGCLSLCCDDLAIECVCGILNPLQSLYNHMSQYSQYVLDIYKATSMAQLQQTLQKIRPLIPLIKKDMEDIIKPCVPRGDCDAVCCGTSCSRNSGLQSHEELNVGANITPDP
jgi:hypothetical protein